MAKQIGKVKLFRNGFGFILRENDTDLFVPYSSIKSESTFKSLNAGQTVEYELGFKDGKEIAINVTVIENITGITNGMIRNPQLEHDTEDKNFWCRKGEKEEEIFVKKIVPQINRNLIIHPNKMANPLHIDLLDLDKNEVADLKEQNTPFFSAFKYNYEPTYTVTFNKKDYLNYKNNYPNATIYWWVNWTQLSWNQFEVAPLYGVWEVPFKAMMAKIEDCYTPAPLHTYQNRIGDKVNATESYLFDLRTFERLL